MRTHADWCEADHNHLHDCEIATELARLRAFAEAVRDEFTCTTPDAEEDALSEEHNEECWHHAALAALGRPRP